MHVLGTPPAFILSQDQTLMFKFHSAPVSASRPFELPALSSFPHSAGFPGLIAFASWIRLSSLCETILIPGFYCVRFVCSGSNIFDLQIEIFKIISRFIHCSVIKVRLLLSALLFKRQLIYYITFAASCQQLFLFYFPAICFRIAFSLNMISHFANFVNSFFDFFLKSFAVSANPYHCFKRAEKEGFEPSRRY